MFTLLHFELCRECRYLIGYQCLFQESNSHLGSKHLLQVVIYTGSRMLSQRKVAQIPLFLRLDRRRVGEVLGLPSARTCYFGPVGLRDTQQCSCGEAVRDPKARESCESSRSSPFPYLFPRAFGRHARLLSALDNSQSPVLHFSLLTEIHQHLPADSASPWFLNGLENAVNFHPVLVFPLDHTAHPTLAVGPFCPHPSIPRADHGFLTQGTRI